MAILVGGVEKEQRNSPVHGAKIDLTWRKDRYINSHDVSYLARGVSPRAGSAPLRREMDSSRISAAF